MSEILQIAKKVMKTVTRADSLLQAIDKAYTAREKKVEKKKILNKKAEK